MKLLLDTHVFLWSVAEDERMSEAAKEEFLKTENALYLSVASYWEICIKTNIGKLELSADWKKVFDREMVANGIKWLPIEKAHCQAITELPLIHRDPFDRLLITQAQCERMTLLTADEQIRQYNVSTRW